MSRSSRITDRRQTRRTFLLVTNGAVTERMYLSELKKRAARRDISITVKFEAGDPSTLMRKLSSPLGNASGYDEIWLVVDEDGRDHSKVLEECRARTRGRRGGQRWACVISRPCFEEWLVAHYENVRPYSDQRDAQAHYERVGGLQPGAKSLPPDFPYEEMIAAASRCRMAGIDAEAVNEMPPSPGSGMPHLLRALDMM